LEQHFSLERLSQFVELWGLIDNFHLDENVDDGIVWRLTSDGQYSTKSAYDIQFLGFATSLNKSVWKAWAPPKVNFSLGLQNK
jgi:hypothetical protein